MDRQTGLLFYPALGKDSDSDSKMSLKSASHIYSNGYSLVEKYIMMNFYAHQAWKQFFQGNKNHARIIKINIYSVFRSQDCKVKKFRKSSRILTRNSSNSTACPYVCVNILFVIRTPRDDVTIRKI